MCQSLKYTFAELSLEQISEVRRKTAIKILILIFARSAPGPRKEHNGHSPAAAKAPFANKAGHGWSNT